MAPVILFPDATALAISHLNDVLPGSPHVGSVVPAARPAGFVLVRRVGGLRNTLVSDAASLAVECWGNRPEDAHDLAQLCRAHLLSMAGRVVDGVPIYRVDEVGGVADLPDPLSDHPRFTFTLSVHMRGVTP